METVYDGSLGGFLDLLEQACLGEEAPGPVRREGRLSVFSRGPEAPESPFFAEFRELSCTAADAAIQAWLSEAPVEREIFVYARKVYAAARNAAWRGGAVEEQCARRAAAENAARDRGDPTALRVLEAAYKTAREIDRLRGLLRFSPGAGGYWIARCAPDHLALPALGPWFSARFGESPWAIIDEKRGLCLYRPPGEALRLSPLEAAPFAGSAAKGCADPWEGLWRQYHRSINNESRKNPGLQRSFMPPRYWKYLSEM